MTRKRETLQTIWEIPDDLWEQIHPVIVEMDPAKHAGRKRVHARGIRDGILFRMRSGCPWNHLPRELGDDSTIQRNFRAGWSLRFWNASGRSWSRSARNRAA